MGVAERGLDGGGEWQQGGMEVVDEGFVSDERVECGGGDEDWRRGCRHDWDANWLGRLKLETWKCTFVRRQEQKWK